MDGGAADGGKISGSSMRALNVKAWLRFFIQAAILLTTALQLYSQGTRPVYLGNNYVTIRPGETIEEITGKAADVTPSANQLEWQLGEFNAFIHFGINTFTGKEWGSGNDDPALFNPKQLDARQWARVIRDAGMKMVIITAKHHDGFCLWPSQYTRYSVAASPWKSRKGDVVGEVAAACREYGLKFGFYLSPWDKHEATYGNAAEYNQFFMNQLRELLTRYGKVSEVWFDGACGEGPNGKKQVYDWKSYYSLIRELQPGAVIAIMGPDVRWVGTESGYGRETEWSVVPDVIQIKDPAGASSQQFPVDAAFTPADLTATDLGSRDKLKNSRALAWYPAETDVSVRPGWFYHVAEDNRVKSPEKLVDIYFHSVGMNSVLLLNIPPDKRGLIHDNDIRSLVGMKKYLQQTFRNNLLTGAAIRVLNGSIEYTLTQPASFNVAMVEEDIKSGQRIEKFHFEAWDGKEWRPFAGGTTVGHKRLLRFPEVKTQKVRFYTDESRADPAIMNIGLFRGPDVAEGVKKVKKTVGTVSLGTVYSPKYTGGGAGAVTDGIRGSYEFTDGRWQGYEGADFIATLDLGRIRPVSKAWAGFLQQQGSWIFMPESVEYFVSDDGKDFRSVAMVQNTVSEKMEGTEIRDFTANLTTKKARYIRIHAHNRGVCPDWHPGAGEKAWIFTDELGVK
jgi:alpha-L-fucosidase